MLAQYETNTRFLLHDPNGQAYATSSVDIAINSARKKVATAAECVRALLSGGTITNLIITNPGSGYAGTATVSFTGPGSQTFATATINAGAVSSIAISPNGGGWGWVTPPTVTVTGSISGNNAVITPVVDNSASTVAGQEVVPYSTLNTLAALTPGIRAVISVNSIACQWGAGSVYKPTLQRRPWSWFQANARVYSIAAMNFPAYWSKFGQGSAGSIYLFPIPSQVMSMDIDAICLPVDLADDTTPEAIPETFQDAVQYYAAYLCYKNSSRQQDAETMHSEYLRSYREARKAMEGSAFVPDQYEAM